MVFWGLPAPLSRTCRDVPGPCYGSLRVASSWSAQRAALRPLARPRRPWPVIPGVPGWLCSLTVRSDPCAVTVQGLGWRDRLALSLSLRVAASHLARPSRAYRCRGSTGPRLADTMCSAQGTGQGTGQYPALLSTFCCVLAPRRLGFVTPEARGANEQGILNEPRSSDCHGRRSPRPAAGACSGCRG